MIKREESGYSMVEVLVAILILVIAIVPMFAMFDLGLRTATTNSNYDKARALAEKQVEFAQSIPYPMVKDSSYPAANCEFPAGPFVESKSSASGCTEPTDAEGNSPYPNLEYNVTKTYIIPKITDDVVVMEPPDADEGGADEDMIQLEICVYREGTSCDDDPIFKTTGVVVDKDES